MATVQTTTYRKTTSVPETTVVRENIVTPVVTQRVIRTNLESTLSRIVWFFIGILETLLILRILFLLLSANPGAGFTQFLYNITQPFVAPFMNIFPAATAGTSYFDTAAVLAMVVWAIIGWGITALIDMIDSRA